MSMDLLLVNPSTNYKLDQEYISSRRIEDDMPNQESPPLGIGYMLAVVKKSGFSAKFINMVTKEISMKDLLDYVQEYKPLLIGFSAYTVQIKTAALVAAEVKKHFPDITLCCGGPHTTAMPIETLKEFPVFDFVVCGEGDIVLPEVLERLKTGKPISGINGVIIKGDSNPTVAAIADLDDLPFPPWEDFDLTKYPGLGPHQTKLELPMSTSRGCPFSCVFCARSLGNKRRNRSVASVIQEIERNIKEFGCEAIAFCDETFTLDSKWCHELFNTMIERGINKKIKWFAATRVDTCSPELFRLMKKAGCYYIAFGLESGDDDILKMATKGFSVSRIKEAVAWAKDAGLICVASFIIGLPGETEESVYKSIKLAKELDIYSTTFPIAVPLPGTKLRELASKHEFGMKILSDNWDDYGKQYPGIMESDQLSIDKRRELQRKAYEYNPKRKILDFMS